MKLPPALLQQPVQQPAPAPAASEASPRCQPRSYDTPRFHPLLAAVVVNPQREGERWKEVPLQMLVHHLLHAEMHAAPVW